MPQLTADSSYLYPSLCRKNYQHSSNSNSEVQVLSPAELLILPSTKLFGGKIKVAANILPLLHPFDYSLFKILLEIRAKLLGNCEFEVALPT